MDLRWALTSTLNVFLEDQLSKSLAWLFASKERFHLLVINIKKIKNFMNIKKIKKIHKV